jgi:hypothetical protein
MTKTAARALMLSRAKKLNAKHGGAFAGLVRDLEKLGARGKKKGK